eukprot:g14906.t1
MTLDWEHAAMTDIKQKAELLAKGVSCASSQVDAQLCTARFDAAAPRKIENPGDTVPHKVSTVAEVWSSQMRAEKRAYQLAADAKRERDAKAPAGNKLLDDVCSREESSAASIQASSQQADESAAPTEAGEGEGEHFSCPRAKFTECLKSTPDRTIAPEDCGLSEAECSSWNDHGHRDYCLEQWRKYRKKHHRRGPPDGWWFGLLYDHALEGETEDHWGLKVDGDFGVICPVEALKTMVILNDRQSQKANTTADILASVLSTGVSCARSQLDAQLCAARFDEAAPRKAWLPPPTPFGAVNPPPKPKTLQTVAMVAKVTSDQLWAEHWAEHDAAAEAAERVATQGVLDRTAATEAEAAGNGEAETAGNGK